MPKRKTQKRRQTPRRRKTQKKATRKRKSKKRSTRRKSKKKSTRKRSYFKRGNPLTEKQRKYCRCIFHVSGQQTPECLRSKDWGGKCYNPYAICTSSTKRRGSFECFRHIDLDDVPEKELKAMAALKGTTVKGLRNKQKSIQKNKNNKPKTKKRQRK